MNLEELIDECVAQKSETFVYDDFNTHMLRCIRKLTSASEAAKDNVQAIYYERGQKGAAIDIANVIAELFAVSKKYELQMTRAFNIVLNQKAVKV